VEELCPLAIRIAGQGIDEYTVTLEIPAPTLGVQLSAKPAAGGLAVPANLVTWSTQDTSIAKVSATGYLTGVARGTTWVSATCGSARAGIGVEVQQFVRYFEKVSGDGQAALVGTKLPLPLVARVKDFAGNPMAGVDVVWRPGSGHVSVRYDTSDAQGLLSTEWTIGTTSGSTHGITLRVATMMIWFSAVGIPDEPDSLELDYEPPSALIPTETSMSVRR
jgi:hypothetical protein